MVKVVFASGKWFLWLAEPIGKAIAQGHAHPPPRKQFLMLMTLPMSSVRMHVMGSGESKRLENIKAPHKIAMIPPFDARRLRLEPLPCRRK